MTQKTLKENFAAHINTDPIANVNAERDWFKRVSPFDSWFIVGHFEKSGEPVDFLYHVLAMDRGVARAVNVNSSIINEKTGASAANDKGTIELKGEKYVIENCKAWFDRQWDVEGQKLSNDSSTTELFSGISWTWG